MYLFATFKDPGDQGIFFCLSRDGYVWSETNGGKPWVLPSAPGGKTRDPFIARDPKGGFILLWTDPRVQGAFGFSRSPDLVSWSVPSHIPAFHDNTKPLNVWAPEAVFDSDSGLWTVFWSSTVPGLFPETEGQVENGKNHRIFARRTADWNFFTDTFVFFDPGYPVIDATVHRVGGGWLMAYKDERFLPLRKRILLARAKNLSDRWNPVAGDMTEAWTEGPSFLALGDDTILFYDAYHSPGYKGDAVERGNQGGFIQHMGALFTPDFMRWENATLRLSMPAGVKHGSFLEISVEEAECLGRSASAVSQEG